MNKEELLKEKKEELLFYKRFIKYLAILLLIFSITSPIFYNIDKYVCPEKLMCGGHVKREDSLLIINLIAAGIAYNLALMLTFYLGLGFIFCLCDIIRETNRILNLNKEIIQLEKEIQEDKDK